MKKALVLLFIISFLNFGISFSKDSPNYNQKVFNSLPKQEKLSMLRSMRKQELNQINSQIKDMKTNIKTIENNDSIPLSKSQEMLLKYNQELTRLSSRKADIERMYEIKIKSVKSGK